MKKKLKLGFTLVELIIVITIISILSVAGNSFYQTFLDSEREDQIESDIKNVAGAYSSIIGKNGGIITSYCKNSGGTYDSNCFKSDPLGNGSDDDICVGDDLNDVDCDNGCSIIRCNVTNDFCSGDNEYYDFEQLFVDSGIDLKYNLKDYYKNNFSYILCPENAIGKAVESDFSTFNPSFSFYNKSALLYEVNSNP